MAPRRNIPKAARRYVWRLAIFYGLGSLAIGVIVPRNNPRLLSPQTSAAASPFVIGIQLAGIHVLNHVINAAILTSAWSAGNAFVYSGSRIIYSMALNGQAPSILTWTTKRGVPWVAVLFTWAFGCLAFLNVSNSGATVFQWFSSKHGFCMLTLTRRHLTCHRHLNHFWTHCVDYNIHHLLTLPQGHAIQRYDVGPSIQNRITTVCNVVLAVRHHDPDADEWLLR